MATDHETVDLVDGDVVRRFARAALFAALIAVTALFAIPIPFSSAPISLQNLVIFLAGVALGPVWGFFSVVLYLVAGAMGAPIFSTGGAGLGHLFGPTAGFLFSFPFAALIVGVAVHGGLETRNPARASLPAIAVGLVAAMILVYAAGTINYTRFTDGLAEAALVMVVPFVPGDLIKMVAVVAIVRSGVIDPV